MALRRCPVKHRLTGIPPLAELNEKWKPSAVVKKEKDRPALDKASLPKFARFVEIASHLDPPGLPLLASTSAICSASTTQALRACSCSRYLARLGIYALSASVNCSRSRPSGVA